MAIHYINASCGDGDPQSLDLFVEADTLAAAIAYWQGHYETEGLPERVYLIPKNSEPGVIPWDCIPRLA